MKIIEDGHTCSPEALEDLMCEHCAKKIEFKKDTRHCRDIPIWVGECGCGGWTAEVCDVVVTRGS